MFKCEICGCDTFGCHQQVRMFVVCDGDGNYVDAVTPDAPGADIYDSEACYGPFVCTHCGAEYEELSEDCLSEAVYEEVPTPEFGLIPEDYKMLYRETEQHQLFLVKKEWLDKHCVLGRDCLEMFMAAVKDGAVLPYYESLPACDEELSAKTLPTALPITPGDKIVVETSPRRMWGGKVRIDRKAPAIKVDAEVLSVTFERNLDTGEIMWRGEAVVTLPVPGRETGYCDIIPISPDCVVVP